MGIQRAAIAVVTLTLLAGALAGCVSPAPKPQPPTQEEIDALREAQAQSWWDSMSTGTTMPDVKVIEQLPPGEAALQQTECLDEAQIPGVTVYGPGEWGYNGALGDDPEGTAAQMQWFVCTRQYPSEADFDWMLSPSQLEWLYDYFQERYFPCLRSVGFEPVRFPSEASFAQFGGSPSWIPYDTSVSPIPTPAEWERIAQRCPLPEMLDVYGIPGYTDDAER